MTTDRGVPPALLPALLVAALGCGGAGPDPGASPGGIWESEGYGLVGQYVMSTDDNKIVRRHVGTAHGFDNAQR